MTRPVPVAIPAPGLPLADPTDRATYAARKLEHLRWEKEDLAPGALALAQVAKDNADDAYVSSWAADASKTAAAVSETNAEASAATATAAAGTNATSTTSTVMGLGAKTLTIQTAKAIVVGMQVVIANTSAPASQYMRGTVTAYNSGTGSLTVNVDFVLGSGTIATWTVSLTGIFVNPAAYQAAAAVSTLNTLYGAI